MLQVTNKERAVPVLIFLTVMAIGILVALYMYLVVNRYSLLYYWDSVSHLVASRKFADWSQSPGIDQIGTVWMPLQHFLLFPFTLVDILFTTGFAGLALSLPCLALTSVYMYKIIKGLKLSNVTTIPTYIALTGALLYSTNPNILYLGITSMTEAPFMLFFVASVYYFQKWSQSGNQLRNLILCSVFISFATLCRYESWFLPLFLIAIVGIFLLQKRSARNPLINRKVFAILASLLSLSSIVFWLAWNQYHYGDAFEFGHAKYYSASWYAQNRPFREILFLQPANVLSIYGVTALVTYGPILLGLGAIGYYFYRQDRTSNKNTLLIFLALPAIFTIISLLIGIGEMAYWFNSRFIILLSPLVIIMVCVFLIKFVSRVRRRSLVIGMIGVIFVYQICIIPTFSTIVTLNDAIGGYSVKENLLAVKTAEVLKSLYDNNGEIMILTGSGLEQRIMITSGIALRHFDEIIESSTWKDSFRQPWNYDRWIVITSHPGSDAIGTTSYWLQREDELAHHYTTLYENEYYKIMVLKG